LWRRPRPKLGCGAKERRRRILKRRDHLSDFGVNGRIILKWILEL
jgi:hypothetical protein